MPIIVAGSLAILPGRRDEFVKKSLDAVIQARANKACEDFSVSPDPLDPNRVNIFERWHSRAELDAFRGAGPETDVFSLVESIDVQEYEIGVLD